MPRSLTRAAAVAAGVLLALPLLAAPAHAWTDRVETSPRGGGSSSTETVEVAPLVTGGRSTLRFALPSLYEQFKPLRLTSQTGGEDVTIVPGRIPNTATAWVAKLGGTPAGTYRVVLPATTRSGEEGADYVFTLTITDAPPATVRMTLKGKVTLRALSGAYGIPARAGSTVRYVAPPGWSFSRARVSIGPQPAAGGPGVPVASPGGTTLTRSADGRSFTVKVPTELSPGVPVTRRGTGLNVVIVVPDAPLVNGRGGAYLFGSIRADPVGTSYYPPSGPDGITDTLYGQSGLRVGSSLTSVNERYRVVMQSDRNLVVYRLSDGRALWSSGRHGAVVTELQQDGTLAQRSFSGAVVWSNGRAGSQGAPQLVMQNDGNLVVYGLTGKALWASGVRG